MKAIIKTGGKQYTVKVDDVLDIEKVEGKANDKISLEAICIIDGDKVEADPAKAAKTPVKAEIIEQHKGEKQIVFKFKRRKNYKVKNGHRQNLTRIKITEIGADKGAKKPAAKKAPAKKAPAKAEAKSVDKPTAKPAAKKPAAKKPAEKKEEK